VRVSDTTNAGPNAYNLNQTQKTALTSVNSGVLVNFHGSICVFR